MSCDPYGMSVSAYLDGELDRERAARVEAHLRECEDCRRSLESWRETGQRLRRDDATPDRAAAVRAVVAARRTAAPVRVHRRSRGWIAAAAAIALVVPVLFYSHASADRKVIEEIVRLEGKNRVDAEVQMQDVDSLRFEIAALLVRARAVGIEAVELQELETEARSLVEESARVRARLLDIDTNLKREGLLGESTEVEGETDR